MIKGDLIKWLRQPMNREHELLLIIGHCGLISPEHIAVLQQVSKTTVVQNVYMLNRQGNYIMKVHPPKNRKKKRPYRSGQVLGPRMYQLGPDAKSVLEEIVEKEVTIKKYTNRLHEHFWGTNYILVELVKAMGYEEAYDRIGWFNTSQAIQDIHVMWDQSEGLRFKGDAKKRFEEKNQLVKPDARCRIDQSYLWIEYDNDSEDHTDVKPKLHGYIYTLNVIGNRDPIVCVVPDEKRKEEFKKWWEEVQRFEDYQKWLQEEDTDFFIPKMLFPTLQEVKKLINIFADPAPSHEVTSNLSS